MEALIPIQYDENENRIIVIDQRALPEKLEYLSLHTLEEVYWAIKALVVRGAPLIGVTAGYGLAMYALNLRTEDVKSFQKEIQRAKCYLKNARPTAVNLENAVDYLVNGILEVDNVSEAQHCLLQRAKHLQKQDESISEHIGMIGSELLPEHAVVMTYCNAGALATSNRYGTALAPVYKAAERGKEVAVVACETRPILQGARLTTFELTYNNIPTTLITDNMVGWYMATHHVDAIFVGCDRVAVNGDFANKIGTYSLSLLAKEHNIPFYVCTPSTTIDFSAETFSDITIEHRSPNEIRTMWYQRPMVAEKAEILNPAFDCTPVTNVTGFITESGLLKPPFKREMFE